MLDIEGFYFAVGFFEQYYRRLTKNPIRKEVWKMHNLAIYELVDAKVRDTINLTAMQHSIEAVFAQVYPEASDIKVYRDFYCYRHPVSLIEERVVRARCLGKVIARATREITQRAMRSYESEGHQRSNQLFKAVKGKTRLRYCLRLLEEISVES